MDRILVNGIWYVKEKPELEIKDTDLTNFLGCLYENSEYCWEATKIYKDDGLTLYDGIDIKFTDKRSDTWKEDSWDNNTWFKGIYEDNKDSIEEAEKMMSESGIKTFKLFLGKLKEKGWF